MTIATPYAPAWDIPDQDTPTTPPLDRVPPQRPRWELQWLETPAVRPGRPARPQLQLIAIRDWTGFSNRRLAAALGTSHPTVAALLAGEGNLAGRPDVRTRVSDLHSLCARLAPLVAHDPVQLRDLLDVSSGGTTVLDLAAGGRVADAYVIALRAVSPRDQDPYPASVFPAIPGAATEALDD